MKNKKQLIFVLTTLAAILAMVVFLPALISADDLKDAPPAWSQKFDASKRFKLVLGDEAVLDKETGVVWEQTPDNTYNLWGGAVSTCIRKEVGGRLGWRLPTVEELSSLVDTTQSQPALPVGHPFSDVQWDDYWSATTTENATSRAWATNFDSGFNNRDTKATVNNYTWCVRGGQGHDGGLF